MKNEGKLIGYKMNQYSFATKKYCQTLNLREDKELIAEYVKRHAEGEFWTEIGEQMRRVGILDMEIFISGSKLFMIVETPEDFDWDKAFGELSKMPKQIEWEEYMSIFQDCGEGLSSTEKWQLMDRIFHIY